MYSRFVHKYNMTVDMMLFFILHASVMYRYYFVDAASNHLICFIYEAAAPQAARKVQHNIQQTMQKKNRIAVPYITSNVMNEK